MSTTNILDLNNRIDALEKNSGGGSADSAKRSDIATEFSATTAYTAGCFVYYEGKLYQFNADHAAGAWDPTDVVEANVTDQVVSNASAIAGLTASDVAYDNTTSGLTATDVQGAVDELADSYPATKVMLSDDVTSVEDALDGLTANNFVESEVNIASYTQANPYICPADGYVRIYVNYTTTNTYGDIRLNERLYSRAVNPANSGLIVIDNAYVKKGMSVYVAGTAGNYEGYYSALS